MMRRCAARTLIPCGADGREQPGRRIDVGDRCLIDARVNGLWPVRYPTPDGLRAAFLPSLRGLAAVYCQRDYPDVPYPARGYEAATVKSGGCGAVSVAMIVETLRPDFSFAPREAAAFAIACGARVPGGTAMSLLGRRLAERWRLQMSETVSAEALLCHLRRGGVAVANVAGRGMFSTGGHYLAVLAEQDGLLTLADPGYYGGKYGARYPRRRAAVQVVGPDHLLRCAPAVLDADCAGRAPRYYLFGAE